MFIYICLYGYGLTSPRTMTGQTTCRKMTGETISGFLGYDCMTIAEAVVTIGCMLTLHIVSLVLRRLGTPGL
jgi:hypothetical protein